MPTKKKPTADDAVQASPGHVVDTPPELSPDDEDRRELPREACYGAINRYNDAVKEQAEAYRLAYNHDEYENWTDFATDVTMSAEILLIKAILAYGPDYSQGRYKAECRRWEPRHQVSGQAVYHIPEPRPRRRDGGYSGGPRRPDAHAGGRRRGSEHRGYRAWRLPPSTGPISGECLEMNRIIRYLDLPRKGQVFAPSAVQPRPIETRVSRLKLPGGRWVTALLRKWSYDDVPSCRLCPKGSCSAVGGECLFLVAERVSDAEAPLYCIGPMRRPNP